MADQLDHSMGSYMTYFQYLCVLLSAVLIYLLTKLIIEKNENAISMVKILGYENREIARLYLLSTTIVLVLLGYAVVTIFDFRRIRKIPMDEALKSAESAADTVRSPRGKKQRPGKRSCVFPGVFLLHRSGSGR